MPHKSRRDMFNELGLLSEQTEAPNPYVVLGLDPQAAKQLLETDKTGKGLQNVVRALQRQLALIYHPDNPATGNRQRYQAVFNANQQIRNASASALSRWTKVEQVQSSELIAKMRTQRDQIAQSAALLLKNEIELGRHPQHHARFETSQGLLLQRGATTLLMQQGLRVLPGRSYTPAQASFASAKGTQALDFQHFLRDNDSFGLEPGAKISAFIDQTGQTSLLKSDLGFIMDVTDAISKYRAKREIERDLAFDVGAGQRAPVLISTEIAKPEKHAVPESLITVFQLRSSLPTSKSSSTGRNLIWHLPMEVAGSLGDEQFVNRARHSNVTTRAQLMGSAAVEQLSYFNLYGLDASRLVDQDAQYTPLLASGNSLLLFEPQNGIPVVTDATIIGMVGVGAETI